MSLIHHTDGKKNRRYSHPFVPVRVVELHVVAGLDPAHGPRLLSRHGRHQDAGGGSEVRRPVAQHHAGRLVDAGGGGVDGRVQLQDFDTVSGTLGLTPDTLDAAHRIQLQRNPQQRPEVWRRRRETHGNSTRITTDGSTAEQKKKNVNKTCL